MPAFLRRMPALLTEGGCIMLGVAVFATSLVTTQAEPLLEDEGRIALYFVAVIAALIVQFLAWWFAPRMMAGAARGAGRPVKWFLYLLGYGIFVALPAALFGFLAASYGDPGSQRYTWLLVLATSALAAALVFILIRATALSISGDRIRFAAIRDRLSPQFPLVALAAFATMVPGQFGAFLPDVAAGWAPEVDRFAVTAVAALLGGVSAMAQCALFVAAYLEVDTYADEIAVRDTFG